MPKKTKAPTKTIVKDAETGQIVSPETADSATTYKQEVPAVKRALPLVLVAKPQDDAALDLTRAYYYHPTLDPDSLVDRATSLMTNELVDEVEVFELVPVAVFFGAGDEATE